MTNKSDISRLCNLLRHGVIVSVLVKIANIGGHSMSRKQTCSVLHVPCTEEIYSVVMFTLMVESRKIPGHGVIPLYHWTLHSVIGLYNSVFVCGLPNYK